MTKLRSALDGILGVTDREQELRTKAAGARLTSDEEAEYLAPNLSGIDGRA
jgi:hypothetical protein